MCTCIAVMTSSSSSFDMCPLAAALGPACVLASNLAAASGLLLLPLLTSALPPARVRERGAEALLAPPAAVLLVLRRVPCTAPRLPASCRRRLTVAGGSSCLGPAAVTSASDLHRRMRSTFRGLVFSHRVAHPFGSEGSKQTCCYMQTDPYSQDNSSRCILLGLPKHRLRRVGSLTFQRLGPVRCVLGGLLLLLLGCSRAC